MRSQLVGPAKFSAEIADDSIGSLAKVLFNDYSTVMELTGLLLITAALGALTLTHRESATKRRGQAQVAKDKLEPTPSAASTRVKSPSPVSTPPPQRCRPGGGRFRQAA